MEKKTNGMSVAALILAIVGMVGVVVLGWLTFGISGIFALVGLILAIIAKKKDSEDKLAKAAFVVSLIAVILGVLTSISCVACGAYVASSDTPSVTTAVTERVETTAEPEKIPESTTEETKSTEIIETTTTETESTEKTYTVGDTITTKKYNFTLTNAINSNVVEGEYKKVAPEGKTYIVLFFEVENITDTDEFVSASMDSEAYVDDYSATEAYISFVDYEWLSGDLAAGKKIKGYVAYEADENWKELEWKYEELFDSETIEFIIHPEDIK